MSAQAVRDCARSRRAVDVHHESRDRFLPVIVPGDVREFNMGEPLGKKHPDHSLRAREVELPAPFADLPRLRPDRDEVGLTAAPHHTRVLQKHVPMRLGPRLDFVQPSHAGGAEPVRHPQMAPIGHTRRMDGERHRDLGRLTADLDSQQTFLLFRLCVRRNPERNVQGVGFSARGIAFSERAQRLVDPVGRLADHIFRGRLIGGDCTARWAGVLGYVDVDELEYLRCKAAFERDDEWNAWLQASQQNLESRATASRNVQVRSVDGGRRDR
jgi:hypothetical protein